MNAARHSGYAVTGIEPSSMGRNHAIRSGLEVYPDINVLLSNQRRFDVVTLWHVLEHLPDPESALRGLHSLIEENGILIVGVPNIRSARAVLLRMFPAVAPKDDQQYRAFPIHLYAFSRRTLSLLARNSGYSVIGSTTRHIAVDDLLHGRLHRKEDKTPFDHGQNNVGTERTRAKGGTFGSYLKTGLKAAFYSLHLGEELVVICKCPNRSGDN